MESDITDYKSQIDLDPVKTCRVCLVNSSEMTPLFSSESTLPYFRILIECCNVSVEENDGLPSVICHECIHAMLQAHKFVLKCQATDKRLRLHLLDSLAESAMKTDNEVSIKKEEPDYFEYDDGRDDFDNQAYSTSERNVRKKRKKEKKPKKNKSSNFPRKCTECEYMLKNESSGSVHMAKHTNEKPYQCTHCGMCYKTHEYLKVHMLRHLHPHAKRKNPPKTLECATCGKLFSKKKDLEIHTRIHTGETPYRCPHCPKAFTQLSTLTRHTRTHTGDRPYQCKECQKRFASSSELKIHQRVHSNEKNYSCDKCSILFKSKAALHAHGITHDNVREFVCDKCGMAFKKKGNLKSHVERTHSDKAGQCCVCNKRFSNLEDHMRTHTGETPFHCHLCDKKFSLKSRLLSHTTYHRELEKHTCQVAGCAKKFPKPSMLVFHVLKYHQKVAPYLCRHCGRAFYRVSDLNRHLKLNHSNGPDIKNTNFIQKNDVE